MKSMTGYGNSVLADSTHEIEVQISSINRRHNEMSIRLPKEYGSLEPFIRRLLSAKIGRGQITVSVSIRSVATSESRSIDITGIEKEIELLKTIASYCHCPPPLELMALEMWKNRLSAGSTEGSVEVVEGVLEKVLLSAFHVFDENRALEGAHIRAELIVRLQSLKQMKETITGLVSGNVERIRQHLKELLDSLVPSLSNDDRIFREVVLYADRSDISEELSRIEHHLKHMEEVVQGDNATGKLLEFILQELLREWNTLGAKTASLEVSTYVVLAKMELEKMREQVQNVE